MTKQDVIIKAYGKYWDSVKDYIDKYGRLNYQKCWDIWNGDSFDSNFYQVILQDKELCLINDDEGNYLPQSLQGIENNNGWIRIESEEDLPKDSHALLWVYTDHGNIYNYFFYSTWFSINELEKVVAYQPITKPLKPIY